jgi:hypothetical protein
MPTNHSTSLMSSAVNQGEHLIQTAQNRVMVQSSNNQEEDKRKIVKRIKSKGGRDKSNVKTTQPIVDRTDIIH